MCVQLNLIWILDQTREENIKDLWITNIKSPRKKLRNQYHRKNWRHKLKVFFFCLFLSLDHLLLLLILTLRLVFVTLTLVKTIFLQRNTFRSFHLFQKKTVHFETCFSKITVCLLKLLLATAVLSLAFSYCSGTFKLLAHLETFSIKYSVFVPFSL